MGPQREDLYQMSAYLWRFAAPERPRWAGVLYPLEEADVHQSESASPWMLDPRTRMFFCTLPPDSELAAIKLRTAWSKLMLKQGKASTP
jgi:5-methylcytosine-specific restriction enzyme subunit McrC